MTTPRQSNLELLRIISMLMVVIVHLDGAVLGLPEPMGCTDNLSARDWWRLIVEAITIIGVNCFTLISGYFGIRARLSGFLKFTFQCLFYAVAVYSIMAILGYADWSWTTWAEQWLIFSHTDLWYIPAYMGLYILSPFLNAGVESLSRKQFSIILAGFITFNIWLGWIWGKPFNPTGYTIIQLIMVYLIGRYIAVHCKSLITRPSTKWTSLTVYVVATIFIIVTSLYLRSGIAFAYNSPAVLLSSVAFFMLFASFRFQSTYINFMANSAFAVYLIHKNPFVWIPLSHDIARPIWIHNNIVIYSIFVIFATLIIFYFSAIVDQLRKFLQKLIFRA